MDDVTLTFDPKMFLTGLGAINKNLELMNDKFLKAQTKSNQNNKTMKLTAMNLMAVAGRIGIVFGMMRGALNQIPEIGRTFSIAGDIFMRNFLWPLRQMLLPILQKVLDWVRDNRAMFVRWGNVVANIFRAIFNIIKSLWEMLKRLWETFTSAIESAFGKTVNSMTQLANMVLFKITAIVQFIIITIEPFFKFLVKMFVAALKLVKNFFSGFITGIGNLMPDLKDLWTILGRIWKIMKGLVSSTGFLGKTFKTLGTVIGMVVGTVFRGAIAALDALVYTVDLARIKLSKVKAWWKNDKAEMARLRKEEETLDKNFSSRMQRRFDQIKKSVGGGFKGIGETWGGGLTKPLVIPPKTDARNTNNVKNNFSITVNESKTPKITADLIGNKLLEMNKGTIRDQKFRSGGR